MGAVMTWISRSASANPAAAQMPSKRLRTMCRASSAAYSKTRPGFGTENRRRHGVPEATATARSRARKLLQHLGSPPTMPTACSDHSPVTNHRGRCFLGALGEAPCGLDGQQGHLRCLAVLGLGHRRRGAQFEEQLLVDVSGLALRGATLSNSPAIFISARGLPWSAAGERGDQLRRHQLDGRRPSVAYTINSDSSSGVDRLSARRTSHAAIERHQLVGAQAFEQAAIAGEHDGQEDMAVEFVDDSRRSSASTAGSISCASSTMRTGRDSAASMCRLPAVAQQLGTAPAVGGTEFDAEQVAHLTIEVRKAGLLACRMPTLTSRCAPRRSARMRSVTDLAEPGRSGHQGRSRPRQPIARPAQQSDPRCGATRATPRPAHRARMEFHFRP